MAFVIKENDTLPNLPFQLFGPDNLPLDLSAATSVSIAVRGKDTGTLLFKKVCDIVDEENGLGEYDWDAEDTALPGAYSYELEILWNTGDIQTIPADTYFDLLIVDDIA
jgi:hypothetical protein